MNKTVVYIGTSEKWYIDLKYQLKSILSDADFSLFDFQEIKKISDLKDLVAINPFITIVDYGAEESLYTHLFLKYKEMLPTKEKVFIGINSDLNEENMNKMIDSGMSFCYQKTGDAEELKFIARNILNIIDDRLLQKGNFAVAKTDQDSIVHVREKITNLTFKKFTIETNFKLDSACKINFTSPLFNKLNFTNKELKPEVLLSTTTFNNKYKHSFENVLISKEEASVIKEDAIKDSKQRKVPMKDSFQLKTIEACSQKKHKYNLWKKQYQNFYVEDDKEEILVLGKNNYSISIKDNKIANKFKIINKIEISRNDMDALNKLSPSFVVVEFESSDYEIDHSTNKAKFKDYRFKQNSVKTILALSELYQNKPNPPQFLILNKTSIPSMIIKKSLKSTFCKIEVMDVEFNDSNISYLLREVQDEREKERKKERKKELQKQKSTNQFFNKKDVLSKNKNLETPLFFEKIEEINALSLELECKIDLLSEYQLLISSTHELPVYKPIKMKYPYEFYLTIIPTFDLDRTNNASKFKRYKAIINGIDNKKRDLLRGFVINFEKQYKAVI